MKDMLIEVYERWQKVKPLPEEHHKALFQWIRMHFNHLSNNFEGNTLTYNETQLLLIHNRTTGDHTLREYEEMKAHDIAFKHIQKLAKDPEPIRETDIRDLNRICLKEPFYKIAKTSIGQTTQKKIIPGEYKKQPNHVLTQTGEMFYFASPEQTSPLMAELTQWIQNWLQKPKKEQQENIVSFLTELHVRFIRIHPFDDGNGRVVRLLLNYILLRLDFLPIVLTDRKEYIKAIQFLDASKNTLLEKLFKDNIIFMLKKGIYAKTHKIKITDPIK